VKGVSVSRTTWVVKPGSAIVGAPGDGGVVLADSLSDFSRFLRPLEQCMLGHQWVLEGRVFTFPPEWYREFDEASDRYTSEELRQIETFIIDQHEDCLVVHGEYLAAVADTMMDDWCDLYRLTAPVGGAREFRESYRAALEAETLEEFITTHADLYVAGLDGLRWDVFAADAAVIAAVREHVAKERHVSVSDRALRGFLELMRYGRLPPGAP
jgi:hypothetical protein